MKPKTSEVEMQLSAARRERKGLVGLFLGMMILLVLMGGFVLFTSFQQGQSADRGRTVIQSLEEQQAQLSKQNQDLECFADTSNRFYKAISDVIVVGTGSDPLTPEQQTALDNLKKASDEISRARVLCGLGGVGETFNTDPATTTTTAGN